MYAMATSFTDSNHGILEARVPSEEWLARHEATPDLTHNAYGMGRIVTASAPWPAMRLAPAVLGFNQRPVHPACYRVVEGPLL
jgi:hypothetical protein